MELAQTSIASALIGAGIAARTHEGFVLSETATDKSVAQVTAKAERVTPLRYSDAQAFAFWTARKTEEKAGAYWSAVAPIMSGFLVNGGTAASVKNKGKAVSPFAAHIWGNKTRKDRAAQAAFMECAKLSPRSCEFSQAEHDSMLAMLETAFYAVLSPQQAKPRAAQATRYTIAQLCEAMKAGQLETSDMDAIAAALPSYASKGDKVNA